MNGSTGRPRPAQVAVGLYDTHMHTPLCKHAVGEPAAYALHGKARGLAGIVMTCHNPLPDGISQDVRMRMEEFETYLQLVDDARVSLKGQVDVRVGLECDYWPGLEPVLEKQLKQATFHHVLGSVHPQIPWYQAKFGGQGEQAYFRTYFEHLALAAESGLFDTLSHPDLVKNVHPEAWDIAVMLPHICTCLDRIAAAGVAMEFNTSGVNKKIPEFNPGQEMLTEMARRNIPIVIGSDSHVPHRVADGFELALQKIEQAGYTHVSYFLDRQRREMGIDDARELLKPVGSTP